MRDLDFANVPPPMPSDSWAQAAVRRGVELVALRPFVTGFGLFLLLVIAWYVGHRSLTGQLVPVSGTVSIEGTPLASGIIKFMPLESETTSVAGALVAFGKFSIPASHGLRPGLYAVAITSPQPQEPSPNNWVTPPARETIRPEYNVNTTLRRFVRAGHQNTFNFEVQMVFEP